MKRDILQVRARLTELEDGGRCPRSMVFQFALRHVRSIKILNLAHSGRPTIMLNLIYFHVSSK
jgi:hypothetical protein